MQTGGKKLVFIIAGFYCLCSASCEQTASKGNQSRTAAAAPTAL